MSINLSSLLAQWLVCFSGLVICVLTQLPAEAAGGDIIISREVKPRAAARQELVPDPNPQLVNPNNAHQVNRALGVRSGAVEVSDSDFANIVSSSALANGLYIFTGPGDPAAGAAATRSGGGASGIHSSAGATGAASRVSGQVNRSVQQGLRPLQNLKGH